MNLKADVSGGKHDGYHNIRQVHRAADGGGYTDESGQYQFRKSIKTAKYHEKNRK